MPSTKSGRALRVVGLALGCVLVLQCLAGEASLQTAATAGPATAQSSGPDQPRITFVFDHPQLSPNHFEILVDRSGKGSYVSHSEPNADTSEALSARVRDEDLQRTILLSQRTTERIFELAKAARYFNGEFDYTKTKIAFTGKKTLSYKDNKRSFSTTFNWSEDRAVDELQGIFLGISSTLESGARLEHMLQHEKLALNSELASLEQATKNRQTAELQLIAAVLKQIAADDSVMVLARRRAERLLAAAGIEK